MATAGIGVERMRADLPYEKATEETAKAVQKVAAVADKSLDTANSFGSFLNTVFGAGFTQIGGAFSDWAHVYRYEQAIKLAEKVRRIHQNRAIEGSTIAIPPRLAIPLLQQATLEDDEQLLDMWAALIANATDPNRPVEARRSYSGLLSSMEPLDALVLAEIYRWKETHPDRRIIVGNIGDEEVHRRIREQWPNIATIVTCLNVSEAQANLALENLDRLGLIYDYTPSTETSEENGVEGLVIPGQMVPVTNEQALIDITHTGTALMVACSP
jgi:hypothetical protein